MTVPPPSTSGHRTSRAAWIVLAIAVVLRVAVQIQNATSNPTASPPVVDGALHDALAREVADGVWLRDAPFERPPLYGYVTGLVYVVCGAEPLAVYALQGLVGLLGLAWLHRFVRQHAPERAALFALIAAALYGPLAFYELEFLPEALSVALTALVLACWSRFESTQRLRHALAAGIACGVLVLDRPNLAFLPLFLALWSALLRAPRAWLPAAAVLAGTAVGVAPAVVHNALAGDASVGICASGGLNFWLGNREGAEASFTGGLAGAQDAGAMAGIARTRFIEVHGREPRNGAELEAHFYREGLRAIGADPVAWLGLVGRKLRALASEYDYEVNASYEAEREVVPALHAFVVPYAVLLALGVLGLLRRNAPGVTLRRGPLLCVVFAVVLSSVVFFVYARFRLPLVPVLAIGAALAIERILADLRERRSFAVLGSLAAVGGLAGLALAPPGPEAARQTSGGHALVAGAALQRGDSTLAREAYERSLHAWPGNASAAAALVNLLLAKQDVTEAERVARTTLEREPASGLAHFAFGLVLAATQREAQARREFASALIHADVDSVRPLLAAYWRARGREDEARAVLSSGR
ncbi:MAG: glycosyltransferase family 39 protein [Planctomycetes bacterium]|nr:glycosyltransferase family 39 protein [Planctomycetota bacterium]MCC7169385.1 glycosyltransferase family 39 protein [Planctomycetota bacterium]